MIIKLTNAVKQHEGKTLLLNTEHILSIGDVVTDDGRELTTIFSVDKELWEVKETASQIFDMINKKGRLF